MEHIYAKNTASAKQRNTGGRYGDQDHNVLTMYEEPPDGEVSIEELEQFALDRLVVLRNIESARARGDKADSIEYSIHEWCRKFLKGHTPQETHRKDTISHYVLRLAFCGNEDSRRWFLSQEAALFKSRFKKAELRQKEKFLIENGEPYKPVPEDELAVHRKNLTFTLMSNGVRDPEKPTTFYKGAFEQVSDLVRDRKVYLSKGFAFVTVAQLASVMVGHFRSKLSKALVVTARQWETRISPNESERLVPMVASLANRYLGPDLSSAFRPGGSVTPQDLPSLAKGAFPLCMRNLYERLHENSHLRHQGRMHLGLFLKGIGLSLEDAMVFWKAEFTKKCSVEKFQREYAYNIRHNYGMEGKRVNYTPYNCRKIISTTPAPGEFCGCPYKQFSPDQLSASLKQLGISNSVISEVLDKTKDQHYQIACGRVFEAINGKPSEGIEHPNQYFRESMRLNEASEDKISRNEHPESQMSTPRKG